MTLSSRHISQAIQTSPSTVYKYVADPRNLPNWASGLSAGVRKEGEDWVSDSPMGLVKLRFADTNTWGVLDHTVTLPNGDKVLNPMRVVPNDKGSEVIFSLFRAPGVSDADFARDGEWITKDLAKLKALLEAGSPKS